MSQPHESPADRRQRILDAAVRVVAARGPHATRIQDVADEAGVAYGLVYHYFGTKDGLVEAVFDENWAIFADVVDAVAGSGRSPSEVVRALLDYVCGALDAYPDRMRVILFEAGRRASLGSALAHPDVARVMARLRAVFAGAALAPDVDAAVLPTVFLGALEAGMASALGGPEGPDVTAVRATVLALMRGALDAPEPAAVRAAAPEA